LGTRATQCDAVLLKPAYDDKVNAESNSIFPRIAETQSAVRIQSHAPHSERETEFSLQIQGTIIRALILCFKATNKRSELNTQLPNFRHDPEANGTVE
jgi:hypothetical protein